MEIKVEGLKKQVASSSLSNILTLVMVFVIGFACAFLFLQAQYEKDYQDKEKLIKVSCQVIDELEHTNKKLKRLRNPLSSIIIDNNETTIEELSDVLNNLESQESIDLAKNSGYDYRR